MDLFWADNLGSRGWDTEGDRIYPLQSGLCFKTIVGQLPGTKLERLHLLDFSIREEDLIRLAKRLPQ